MALRGAILGIGALALSSLGGCGIIYTNPTVSEGSGLGSAEGDLAVTVVALTYESTASANLDPYVPARLPLGFQLFLLFACFFFQHIALDIGFLTPDLDIHRT